MNDREKVINKVTAIVADMQEEVDEWKDYSDSELRGGLTCDCDWWYKTLQTLKDALALLKAQEPRVITLEEVKAMKRYTICAVEQRSKVLHTTFNAEYYGTVTIGQRNYLDFGLYADVNPFRRSEGGYGKTWRCWTSHPTDEQREAEPWN